MTSASGSSCAGSGYAMSSPARAARDGIPGGAGVPTAKKGSIMELEHAIGTNGIASSVHVIPGTMRYVAVNGGCMLRGDIADPHVQEFLRGHDDIIVKLILSEDGKYAVTGQRGANADVCLWSMETGALIRRFQEHEQCVQALDISVDNTIIASIGSEQRLVFMDSSNGGVITHTSLNQVVPVTDQYCGVYFGPRVQDNKRRNTNATHVALVTTSQIILFHLDPYTGTLQPGCRVNTSAFQRRYSVGRFTCNGDFFLLGTEAGDVAVIDTQHGSIVTTVRVCSGGVRDLLVSGSLNHNDALAVSDQQFRYAKFGPGSERRTVFFVGGGDGTVAQVDIPDHMNPTCNVISKKMLSGSVVSLSIIASGSGTQNRLLAGTSTGSLFAVDMTNAAASFPNAYTQVPASGPGFAQAISDSVSAPLTVVAVHPSDPERFFTASQDGLLRSWDLNTYRQTQVFESDAKTVASVSCSSLVIADGLELMLSGWSDGAIRCHDLTNGKLLWTQTKAHRTAVTAITLSPSLKFFVTGSNEGEIKVSDIRTREVKLELKDHSQGIVHLQLFDDDRHLLSASKDRTFCTWDLTTGRRVTSHEAHNGPMSSALLSRNQTEVYTVGLDHRLNVYDLRYREPARSAGYAAPGSDAYATRLRRSVDERLLVTAGTDQVVKLWEPRTLSCVATEYGHSGTVTDVAFTCDNRQVVSCGAEGSIMIWNVYA